jgi:hypothetical protein
VPSIPQQRIDREIVSHAIDPPYNLLDKIPEPEISSLQSTAFGGNPPSRVLVELVYV